MSRMLRTNNAGVSVHSAHGDGPLSPSATPGSPTRGTRRAKATVVTPGHGGSAGTKDVLQSGPLRVGPGEYDRIG